MPSQRIKYALAHLSREEHTAQLARPNWRRLRKIDTNVLASPFTVRRAALRSRASKRIRIMAQPKFVTKKYDPAVAPPPYPRIHPKTLAAKSSRRIVDLALPKRRVLLETIKLAATKNMKATVSDLLVKVRKSRYQRYRVFCNARQEREARKKRRRMAKLRKALTKPEDWQRHMRVLERLAAPKVAIRPKKKKLVRKIKKKKRRPIDMERTYFLALPIARIPLKMKDPLKVSARALNYRITKRVERLAIKKERPEIQFRIPGAVAPAAMKAIASERIIALAKPVRRPAGMQTDLREDAFVVSPAALTARCSRRLKNLSKPKKYPKPIFKRLKTALKR
ncbi:sperm microtubule associated protein 2-like [Polyergus mexicanus]|uniref:sperm microtubule associated protein 2-like n=1 Tax=Polyergus mexicanus TaxID=615972 RepID=UPI0038B47F25